MMLLLPPMLNNLPPFLTGFAHSLLLGSQRMDVILEQERIGYLVGQDRKWLPLEEITRVERFADVWVILSSSSVIEIPSSVVDERYIAHVQAVCKKGRKVHGKRSANDRADTIGDNGTPNNGSET